MKYYKWVFKDNIAHRENQKFEVGKVITCDTWNPDDDDLYTRGGFYFTNEECALRWMSRGDTLYEVEIPSDGEIHEVQSDKTPGGKLIANKIILKNPIPISNELLVDFYKKSKLPLTTYFETVGLLSSRGYYDLALQIIKDKTNMDNIDLALNEFNNSLKPWFEVDRDCYNKVKKVLEEIKSSVDISLFVDKEPYIKKITNDNIINLTGQSGSGKSTYARNNFSGDKYLIIDTDDIFSEDRYKNAIGINKELGKYFRDKYDELPNCGDNFDLIYKEILVFCKTIDKTIVIDCAQFHCIKDTNLLKGTLIVIRTCIDTCYNRTIERYLNNHPNCPNDELDKYKERKKSIFKWYKYSNEFLEKIDGQYIIK